MEKENVRRIFKGIVDTCKLKICTTLKPEDNPKILRVIRKFLIMDSLRCYDSLQGFASSVQSDIQDKNGALKGVGILCWRHWSVGQRRVPKEKRMTPGISVGIVNKTKWSTLNHVGGGEEALTYYRALYLVSICGPTEHVAWTLLRTPSVPSEACSRTKTGKHNTHVRLDVGQRGGLSSSTKR